MITLPDTLSVTLLTENEIHIPAPESNLQKLHRWISRTPRRMIESFDVVEVGQPIRAYLTQGDKTLEFSIVLEKSAIKATRTGEYIGVRVKANDSASDIMFTHPVHAMYGDTINITDLGFGLW